MNIKINNMNYDVELDHNLTTNDILKNLPLNLHLSRYAIMNIIVNCLLNLTLIKQEPQK